MTRKILFSFLVIFGVVVNELTDCSQTYITNYTQFSNVIYKREFSQKISRLYVYNQQRFSRKEPPSVSIIYYNLRITYANQMLVILKSRIRLYQKITSIKAYKNFFLSIRITANNPYHSLYIA